MEQNGQPMLKFRNIDAVRLQPAAAPCTILADGKKEFVFVCTGIPGMGARLTWSSGKRTLELLFSFVSIALDRDVGGGRADFPVDGA